MAYQINFGPWGSVFVIPTAVADRYLKFCSELQLKVLLLALRQGQSPVDSAAVAARLGIGEAEVDDCLQYWLESGLFCQSDAPAPAPLTAASQALPPRTTVERTPAAQTITTLRARGHLSPAEINTLLREDRQFAGLAAELERARGSVLSPSEQEILAYLFGSLELSPDYLLVAAAYCRDKGKKKLSYLEKMIAGWLEQGIDTYEKAEGHIRRLVRQEDREGRVRRLFGLPERALTAAVAECGGHSLLLDCGEGTQTAARRAGVNLMRADAICLTHYHGDHIFGLPGLLQTLGAQGRTRPLALLGPEGLLEVWRAVYALTGPLPYAVKPLVCRAGQPVALDALSDGWPAGATLLPVATKHRVRSLGYRLELPRAGRFDPEKARALGVPVTQWRLLQRGQAVPLAERMVQPAEVLGAPRKGLRFVFSGDSAPCPALEQAAQGADLLLCDATYALPEQQEQAAQWGHSTFGQSAALAAKAGAKRLWLVHYSPMITDPEEQLAQAQSIFPAAECGFDGKRITLHYEENEE